MWDLNDAKSLEEMWKLSMGFLSVELSADRAVVLFDEEGNQEFAVVAHRRVDPHQLWTGIQIDLSILKQSCRSKQLSHVKTGQRSMICCPVLEGEQVSALFYLERAISDDEFSDDEIAQLEAFAARFAARLPHLRPAAVAPPPPAPEVPASAPAVEEGPWEPVLDAPPAPAEEKAVEPPPPAPEVVERPTEKSGVMRGLVGGVIVGGRYAVGLPFLVCRFSTLYRGVDRTDNSPLVLRKLEGTDTSREARQQMLREGRFLSRLVHRNLPRVTEVIEDKGQVYLVLEEFLGTTLEQVVHESKTPIAPELLLRYLEQFLDVLDYLHNQDPPIIHRDLRPDSVLVTTHGVLKLAEFGLAKLRESRTDPRQTVFRALGSPFFAPADQLLGEPSVVNHDIYAVGSILYFLATGTQPTKSVDRFYGVATLTPLRELRPDLEASLASLIEDMMEAEIDKRLADVEAVRARVAALSEEPAVVLTPAAPEEEQVVLSSEASYSPTPVRTQAPATRASVEKKPTTLGLLAEKFGAWNFLLRNRKKEAPKALAIDVDDDIPILEFQSDLASGGDTDLSQANLSLTIGRLLPETVARAIQGVVIDQPSPQEIRVAVKDPTEVHIYDHIALATQGELRPTLLKADGKVIDLAIEYIYRSNQYSENIPWNEWLERKQFETDELKVNNPMADIAFGADEITSPIIATVDKLIKEAISVGASDIHLETFEPGIDVRYRIDGELHVIDHYPAAEASAIVKRLKVMANMDIAQERITQGGRISLRVGGKDFDLRVSIVPVPNGESVVMRILKKGAFTLTLADLGFEQGTIDRFDRLLAQPYGMILVCGPTGSGKSTTLYAGLKQIQRPDRKLLTVEDPIEYQMAGICQVQVNMAPREDERKVTFAKVLREFLRQDPDVILVGEIRDSETASIAVQAALTGHMLLSTIHTNDSVGIIARLTDMQVEPFLIGSTLLGGLAQRLARRICSNCREEIKASDELKRIFDAEKMAAPATVFHGVGCKKCHMTGSRGRVGLYELMEVVPEIRDLINRRALEEEVRRTLMASGFKTLYHDGLTKVAAGMLTLEEVQRVCKTI